MEERRSRRIVLVTGFHLCGHEKISAYLHKEKNHMVLWPGQDVAVAGGQEIYAGASANLEFVRLHEDLLWDSHNSWIDSNFPKFHNYPYPGPREYIANFPKDADIVMADPRAMLFSYLWLPHITHLIYIDREIKSTALHLEGNYGLSKWPYYNRIDWERNCTAYYLRFEPYIKYAKVIPFSDLWGSDNYKKAVDEILGSPPLTFMEAEKFCYTRWNQPPNEKDVVNEELTTKPHRMARKDRSREVVPITGEAEASYIREITAGIGKE